MAQGGGVAVLRRSRLLLDRTERIMHYKSDYYPNLPHSEHKVWQDPGSRPPYHLKHPKQYFDFKTFRNMLKHKKQTLGRAEKRLIKRAYAKPPPSEDWDVLKFLQEMDFGENAEEVASCFEDWSDFISSEYEDIQRVEMASEQRRKLMVYLRKFNHGVWPDKEYMERFKGTPLEREGQPWTDEEDERLVKLAEVYDVNFGDPWIYLSWELQRPREDVINRYMTKVQFPKQRQSKCELAVTKSARPLMMSRRFSLLAPTCYVIPTAENFPVVDESNKFSLPASFQRFRRPECF